MLDPRLVRIAVIGALVAALGLAGCGRKGGLDPPPGATAAAEQSAPPGAAPPAPPDALLPPTQPLPRRTPRDRLIAYAAPSVPCTTLTIATASCTPRRSISPISRLWSAPHSIATRPRRSGGITRSSPRPSPT